MSVPEKALVPQEDSSMLSFVMTVDEARCRLDQLQQFIKQVMVPNEDYGQIPGCPKPSLLKPGAEKLCEIYGLAPTLEVTHRIEDWDKGFFHYEAKCSLISKRHATVIAEGIGSCNSKEKRYKNQDAYTLVNTILKMAKKRALVDAVLSATRSSGIFTQDAEDIEIPEEPNGKPAPGRQVKPATKNNEPVSPLETTVSAPPREGDRGKALARLFAMLKGSQASNKYNKGLTEEEARAIIQAMEEKSGIPFDKWTVSDINALYDKVKNVRPEKVREKAQAQLARRVFDKQPADE